MPRRGRHDEVELFAAVLPRFERGGLDTNVGESRYPLTSQVCEGLAGLDCRERAPERGERSGRLAGSATQLEDRTLLVHTGHRDEILEEFAGVRRANPVVHIGDFVEHSAQPAIKLWTCVAPHRPQHRVPLPRTTRHAD